MVATTTQVRLGTNLTSTIAMSNPNLSLRKAMLFVVILRCGGVCMFFLEKKFQINVNVISWDKIPLMTHLMPFNFLTFPCRRSLVYRV